MQPADPAPSPDPRVSPRFPAWLAVPAIFAATLAAYAPAMRGLMLWDDAAHVTAPALQGPGGLWSIWFRLGTTQQYYPLLHSAFWLEHRLWGDSVLGYHLVNAGLHATAACLFALVLLRIVPDARAGGAPAWAAWLAAAVFALHPVCVESVAWISEQKNTLSLVFYLLSALAYLRFDRERRWRWYAAALALFLCAVLSKSVTATLPAALLLVLAWRRPLEWRRDVLPLVPWLLIGAGAGLFTAWVEQNFIGARGRAFELGALERCLLAGRVVWFYVGKLFWPADLAFIYPRWHVSADWTWSLGCLGLAAAFAILYGIRRWSRAPLVAALFFVGSLFPALGFFNVYPFVFSYVADHWQYLPSLGLIALASGGAAGAGRLLAGRFGGRSGLALRCALAAAATGILLVLFVLTRRQCQLYTDVGALYTDTLSKNPDSWMAHSNLGVSLMERGLLGEAIPHLEEAVRLKPDQADAHNNLGNALSKVPGRSAAAIAEFEAALRLDPALTEAHANLGWALVNTPGRLAEGIAHLELVLVNNAENPQYARVHANLGAALARVPGRLPRAIAEFEAALRLDPGAAGVRNDLGIAMDRAGRPLEAMSQFERLLRAEPGNPEASNNLGNVLLELGRGQEAIPRYREAIRLRPDYLEAHFNLARALRTAGDDGGSVAEHEEALRLAPDSAEIRSSLGSLLLKLGRTGEALGQYAEAVRLEPGSAPYHNHLGIALTSAGRLDEAAAQFRKALELAPGYSDAHYNLGVALEREGRADEAAAEYSASGRRGP
ncbi:MAG: tetratricopeptide repeat protein [Opitutaceae bacterium]|jgi:tetratricopeptide (TPR) repeat protein